MRLYFPRKRIFVVLLTIIFLFTAVFFKLFYVQIIEGEALQARASEQWMRDVPLVASRGIIFDSNGVPLANTSTKYTVYVRPKAVDEVDAVVSLLVSTLGVDGEKLKSKIEKRSVSEITVQKKIDKETMLKLVESGLKGIYLSADISRYYPYGDFMTQLLGFTNVDGVGQTGLEAYYNSYLQGTNGYILTESDLIGRELGDNVTAYVPAISGLNLNTTLDYKIQEVVENVISAAAENTKAKRVSCLVINPTDGSILAMAETPSFDLNNVPRDDLTALFAASKNSMVSSVFELGSTFKILTTAIALENGIVGDNKTFFCAGSRVVDGQKIKCWKTKGHGSQTFAEGVKNSCNCVFMDLALGIGTDGFYDYLNKFGLTKKTGIDITGEKSGLFLKQSTVKNVDLARIGFGQAVAVTPIGLAAAVASCINGGNAVTPHILDTVTDNGGKLVYRYSEAQNKTTVSDATSKKLIELLYGVVEEGSGKGAYVAGYKIGGKTGTAQKYSGGAIASGKYVSSFVGYTLMDGAEAMVVFLVDEPVGPYYGSVVAAPYVGDIFEGIFAARNIAPSYSERDLKIIGLPFELPSLVGLSVSEAKYQLYKLELYCEIDGEGGVVKEQLPAAGATVNKTNVILLYA